MPVRQPQTPHHPSSSFKSMMKMQPRLPPRLSLSKRGAAQSEKWHRNIVSGAYATDEKTSLGGAFNKEPPREEENKPSPLRRAHAVDERYHFAHQNFSLLRQFRRGLIDLHRRLPRFGRGLIDLRDGRAHFLHPA